ncbi:hypothetical protein PENSTE_c004G03216 [Penicillium steckii]|uniref:Uncharacterized protein n=1 Tax=Penicillium steckii TaxID=303698 RepID=A0A1V6TP43_9EURO|nr:hypothetical protein PENSTE_c004G03216 [Penicillium steckii]
MGRQAYLNRLALGRSPYEPPETATVDPASPVRRVSHIHSDNYMQQYDSRGHPVNPESKNLGRELRKAKNDILSTMGIVVSGDDHNASSSNEQQRISQITAENDFGLVITTTDQLLIFFGSWWTSSLVGRIQTFKHYTHAALLDVIRNERGTTGIMGFYFAGMPAWAMSTGFAIARDNTIKRVWTAIRDYALNNAGNRSFSLALRASSLLAYFTARNCLLVLSVEAYMYSILQTLFIVPPTSIPGLRLLIPLREGSLIQLPELPTEFTALSIAGFLARLVVSPGALTFLYAFYLRPMLEERIYRLIRRQLPKPVLADELSIRVAFEENLVEWVVPSLGRRADEEARRAKMTLLQDLQCELAAFRDWVFSFFGLFSRRAQSLQALEVSNQETIEHLQDSIESLRHELDEVQIRNGLIENGLPAPFTRPPGPVPRRNTIDLGEAGLAPLPETGRADDDMRFDVPQVLTNENRMSQSPGEMSNDFFSEMATIGRTSAPSHSTISNSQSQPSNAPQADTASRGRQTSRSNTLFSRPSSPETSPPTSPRVRASLIHQSSDIITMQLELLGNRTRNAHNPASVSSPHIPRLGANDNGTHRESAVDRRSIADFLEALILSQAQHQAAQSPLVDVPDDVPAIAATANLGQDSPFVPNETQAAVIDDQTASREAIGNTTTDVSNPHLPNILPDGVEEPNDVESNPLARSAAVAATQESSHGMLEPHDARIPAPSSYPPGSAHRVTLLSAHPVDSLATHLAAILSNIILSPLECLCHRSLAHSYLATHFSSTTQPSDLNSINSWFGGDSWDDMAAYTGRLILMRGMQAALRAGVWGFLVGSTMRIGRKFCGWGTL